MLVRAAAAASDAARARTVSHHGLIWRGLAVVAASVVMAGQASAQDEPGGIVGSAVQRLDVLGDATPGLFYYGVTGADRGLGYDGSFMSAGGFIPYGEDSLGGVWNADLRSSLSDFGGFFSNVGIVRKQFIGGMVGGFGVFWDYDGDQNQYITLANPTGLSNFNMASQFGQAFNQVGVSGELLTDLGNARVNGYLPTDPDGRLVGTPQNPFYQNFLLNQTGFYGALTGVDGELGAYVPGLSDWAGVWSVGGYCFGSQNMGLTIPTRADSFGGVFTRLDMTFARNWDFQIRANNDSIYEWTGWVSLTYRVGGSRRRNVPDQMEQPMLRNAHIVRYSRNPVAARNPRTGAFWNVTHVSNTAAPGGNGTAESPFSILADTTNPAAATNSAVNALGLVKLAPGVDPRNSILFVRRGTGTTVNYNVQPNSIRLQPGQQMLGEGVPHSVLTQQGVLTFTGSPGKTPLITSTAGVAPITLDGDGATVSGLRIQDSIAGVVVSSNVNGASALGAARIDRVATENVATGIVITDVAGAVQVSKTTIDRSGLGVDISDSGGGLLTGGISFTETVISNATGSSFAVSGGSATIDFRGRMEQANGAELIGIADTTGGVIRLAGGAQVGSVANALVQDGGNGISVARTDGDVVISSFDLTGNQAAVDGNGVINIAEGTGTVMLVNGSVADGFGPAIQITDKPLGATSGGVIVQSTDILNMADDPDLATATGNGINVRSALLNTNVLLQENTFSNQVSPTANGINIVAGGGNTIDATLLANAARGNQAGARSSVLGGPSTNRALVVDASAGNVNLNAPQNEFRGIDFATPAPAFTYRGMRLLDNAGSLRITQQNVTDFQARNGGLADITGTPAYGAPAPSTPSVP